MTKNPNLKFPLAENNNISKASIAKAESARS